MRAVVPEISVVIPTHNRLAVLPRVVRALEEQHDAPACELIVVDDGSPDDIRDWLERYSFRLNARVISQPNRGPAAARNRGIELATGQIVAFLGDDIVPDPGWLAAHTRAHRERRGTHAFIGYTRWHERLRLNPFLRFLNEEGLQFGYALIEDRENLPFNFFYASNISVPRESLVTRRFDERFPYAAWEDIELGYRLTRDQGLRLGYLPDAVAAHDHPTTVRRFMIRQERVGYSAVIFALLHPELGDYMGVGTAGPPPVPSRGRQVVLELAARAAEPLPITMRKVWKEILRYHYIRGLQRAWTRHHALIAEAVDAVAVARPRPDAVWARRPLVVGDDGRVPEGVPAR